MSAHDTRNQIERLVTFLVERGISSDQNFCVERNLGDHTTELSYPASGSVRGVGIRSPYDEMYELLSTERAFHVRMIDGALMQLEYRFRRDAIQYHRLTWFPSPYLEDFQTNPDIYEDDEVFGDIIARRVIVFPIRFDYDVQHDGDESGMHPLSHLTLGQYSSCRIPVSRPLTPFWFLDFILRNFYAPALVGGLPPSSGLTFQPCISDEHSQLVHLQIPDRQRVGEGGLARLSRGARRLRGSFP